MILTTSAKGAREGARVKIMPVGCPQTAGRASRSGAGLTIGRRGGGTSAALFSMVGAWLKKWLGWMDQDGMVVGWLSSGWTDGCVRMGHGGGGRSADEGLLSDGRWKVEKARSCGALSKKCRSRLFCMDFR